MNLFFYIVNNNIMKKIILLFLLLFDISSVSAIENIEIDGEYLIPKFDKDVTKYNYFTTNDRIEINTDKSNNEIIYGSGPQEIKKGKNTFEIVSSNNEKYIINVFKNYKKNKEKGYLKSLSVQGYDLKYNKNVHEYRINGCDDDYLKINYELSNDNVQFSITGNGDFNKSDNVITIKVNDEKYLIHVLKSAPVSHIVNNTSKEMTKQKKETIIFILIIISLILIYIYYYSLFIFN